MPVLIHIADPVAFFTPLDRFNERWEELHENPDWHFYPTRPKGDLSHPDFPSFDEIMEQFESLLRRHPGTDFIGAHVGCYAENLGWVGRVMDACPNFYADISARIAELGRQPYTARDFFIAHQDRILFGTDSQPDPQTYAIYYRFLETRDEYFNYGREQPPGVGRWQIYGLDLPDDVLRKVYAENARRVIFDRQSGTGNAFGIDKRISGSESDQPTCRHAVKEQSVRDKDRVHWRRQHRLRAEPVAGPLYLSGPARLDDRVDGHRSGAAGRHRGGGEAAGAVGAR